MAFERRRVLYEGRVQGVGFRYTAARLAEGFAVTGWVRNLDDGRVELEAQGRSEEVRGFLDAVRSAMGAKVYGADESPATVEPGEAPPFEIRHD